MGLTLDLTVFQSEAFTTFFECEYATGNGYLFIFHPDMNPVYCSYDGTNISARYITLQVRDFNGVPEPGVTVNNRPSNLTNEHNYNLNNQGWTSGASWSAQDTSSTVTVGTGSKIFTIASGLTITNGDVVQINGFGQSVSPPLMQGTVTNYVGTQLTVNVTFAQGGGGTFALFLLNQVNVGYITSWHTGVVNYPSNADQWWRFKDSTNTFSPATMASKVTLNTGPAPKGHYLMDPFNQRRTAISGVSGITDVITGKRPRTGTWFQGRLWYAGVDANQAASGDMSFYSWSENIYFSQVAEDASQFGYCYQNNDPTAEDFFDLLPTDGGVIIIHDAGAIYKLFPVQNGLLVFAANGIWFITGSQGIGFAANDYTITKISSIRSISSTSFINILGWPVFWNLEGIYEVSPSPQGGGLAVNNLCYGTILTYYDSIPNVSKKYARGDYDPINFVISWVFKPTQEAGVGDRYDFDGVLNFNTANKAFYPYQIDNSFHCKIHDVKFISPPSTNQAPDPTLKYLVADVGGLFTFAEEKDNINFGTDFNALGGTPYEGFFVTGYNLKGQGLTKQQQLYLNIYNKVNRPTSYKIQGIWDYANDPNSGRYTTQQLVTNASTRVGVLKRRHKIRGRGEVLQFKISSVPGFSFDIIGWTSMETINTGM